MCGWDRFSSVCRETETHCSSVERLLNQLCTQGERIFLVELLRLLETGECVASFIEIR